MSDEENERACDRKKEITHNADQVAQMLNTLDEMGTADNTIVIFAVTATRSASTTTGTTTAFLYDASMGIPLIIKAPGMLEAAVNTDPVRSIDVMLNVLGMADIAIPSDGVTCVERPGAASWRPTSPTSSGTSGVHQGRQRQASRGRTGDWKLIYTRRRAGAWELFNEDDRRLTNLFETGEGHLRSLDGRAPGFRRRALALNATGNRFDVLPTNAKVTDDEPGDAEDATSDEELSETERRMLQALGYVE